MERGAVRRRLQEAIVQKSPLEMSCYTQNAKPQFLNTLKSFDNKTTALAHEVLEYTQRGTTPSKSFIPGAYAIT